MGWGEDVRWGVDFLNPKGSDLSFNHILAKSSKSADSPLQGETLIGHTLNVIHSFQKLFGEDNQSPTRLLHRWLHFFKLDESVFDSFYINGIVAASLHDIGKANSGFQEIVRGKKGRQVLWHDHISALILWLPSVREQLEQIEHIDLRITFSAIAGHHLRSALDKFAIPLNPDIKIFRFFPESVTDVFSLLFDHIQHQNTTSGGLDIPTMWNLEESSDFNPLQLGEKIKKELYRFKKVLRKNNELNRLLMAVRSSLIVSDSVGSALFRENKDICEWLNEVFGQPLTGKYIQQHIIQSRVNEIKEKQNSFQWNDFQLEMDNLPERVLLLSPCGSGKTLAAWRWIQARLNVQPSSRVIFLYPTRATATEGFRDYVSWAPEADASLIHGTAAYDLIGMFDHTEDKRYGKSYLTEDRLFALGYWPRTIFSATVDQFLGFMQQVYSSVCLLPLLADSVIVFDEVHSFDRSLFSALKLFLKNFNIPTLCMTASLPTARCEALQNECGLSLFPSDTAKFADLERKAEMPRYQVKCLEDKEAVEEIFYDIYADEIPLKILWVVNTVSRCQEIAKSFNALCYHSRFKLEHRKNQHNAVVKAFKQENGSILAVTTQVCEMSLDLSADILISEQAPITSLIQRMGRCNRHDQPLNKKLGKVYFYPPDDEKPYSMKELEHGDIFAKLLDGKDISQKTLEILLEKYGPNEIEVEKYAAFLENGPWAQAREASLRDETDFTVTALLNEDISNFYKLRNRGEPVDGLFLSVPKKFAYEHSKIGKYPLGAPATHYDPQFGFFEHPVEEIL